ncbi:MAG: class I SAM-dependent methyltransferase [Verrucomicrobiales bacterium]|nr:class I SAM-dependent methyltransferase [Verrucomicrobiales bacterium]
MGKAVLKENGVIWTSYLRFYYLSSAVAERSFAALDERRKRLHLPGLNSAGLNKLIWESWDWNAEGEEWTPSPEWKRSVLDTILAKHIPENGKVVEIGPGGGRWTETLLERSDHVTAVDISEECLKVCSERFSESENISFVLTPGDCLPEVEDGSIDAIWSFDVFVHINRKEVSKYAIDMFRVLRPGGVGVIHHGTVGGENGGWRSNMTAQGMIDELESAGFEIVDQFTEWTDQGKEHQAGLYGDAVTVFKKPG